MSEVNYGFVDTNNQLIFIAVCIENDTETIERIKNDVSADAYYLFDPPFTCSPFASHWNGEKFVPNSPYPSWIWNDEFFNWEPPVQMPNLTEEGMMWAWNESTLSWEAKAIEENTIY